MTEQWSSDDVENPRRKSWSHLPICILVSFTWAVIWLVWLWLSDLCEFSHCGRYKAWLPVSALLNIISCRLFSKTQLNKLWLGAICKHNHFIYLFHMGQFVLSWLKTKQIPPIVVYLIYYTEYIACASFPGFSWLGQLGRQRCLVGSTHGLREDSVGVLSSQSFWSICC